MDLPAHHTTLIEDASALQSRKLVDAGMIEHPDLQ